MVSMLKGTATVIGLFIAALLILAFGIGLLAISVAFYVLGPFLILLTAFGVLALPAARFVPLIGARRPQAAAMPVSASEPIGAPQHQTGGITMRVVKARMGPVDWGFLAGVAVLVAAEVAAALGGLGPFFGVVALGYFLVLALAYIMYRYTLSVRTARARAPAAAYGVSDAERRKLREVDIFAELSDAQIDRVVSLGRRARIAAGQELGEAGQLGHSLFIIMDGNAQLSAESAIGEITVRIAGPGESFPLAALIGSGSLITSVKAMTDMEAIEIPRAALLGLFARDAEIGMRIYAAIAETLGNRYDRTLAHLTSSAERALKRADFWANV